MEEPLSKLQVIDAIDSTKNWLGTSETEALTDVRDLGKCVDVLLDLKREDLHRCGIAVETQFSGDIGVMCSIEAVEEFLMRLIDNSITVLQDVEHSHLRISCTRDGDIYTLVYQDSREEHLPQAGASSFQLSGENPFSNIHGILGFGHFAFDQNLTWTSDEMRVGLKLLANDATTTVSPVEKPAPQATLRSPKPMTALPIEDPSVAGFEIALDTDHEAEDLEILQPIAPIAAPISIAVSTDVSNEVSKDLSAEASSDATLSVLTKTIEDQPVAIDVLDKTVEATVTGDIDKMVEAFELKELNFDETLMETEARSQTVESPQLPPIPEAEMSPKVFGRKEDADGMVEFQAGDLKLKIRSPKKRSTDVHG